jgi:predicted DNA-binding protein (MmcQ/YjbR family)
VDLRALAMSLPGAWEDNPFGHATPLVKVGPDRGEALRGAYPGVVTVAPYLSKRHWVAIRLGAGLDPDEVADLLRRSHALVVAGLPRRDRPGVD